MIESDAYFEAYRYTLTALQMLNNVNLPLQRYIIKADKDLLNPSYITAKTVFDFSGLISKDSLS